MPYKFISPNIIVCENFLPESYVNEIYNDLIKNKDRFKQSVWSSRKNEKDTKYCKGNDFWIDPENSSATPAIWNLQKYFFSKEFLEFISEKNSVFSLLLGAKISYNVHCVTYKNGGSYDKHMDQFINRNGNMVKNFFTFNLTLQKSDDAHGGEVVLYDDKEIIIDKFNNMITIFPTYIEHAVKEVKMKKNAKYENHRFSMQFWVSII